MYTLNSCLEIINGELEQLKDHKKEPAELYEPIYYILSLGGKRIRPVLTLMACNLFTDDLTQAIKPALAIEVFHNFTLVHDDIMDNAALRRNQVTIHEKWNSNVAILSGDAMQIYAYQLLCETDMPLLKKLIDIYNSTALEVCEGQQYDMNFATFEKVTLPQYIRMIELKTSVLLAASLKIGATCANASEKDSKNLYEFGRNLGLAFQIQDDYLDVYADQEIFGKTVGGDIAENKKTYLLIKALEMANPKQAKVLTHAMTNQLPEPEKVEMVKNIFDELNIASIARNEIQRFSDLSFCFLDLVEVDKDRKTGLRDLANDLINRDR